MVTRWGFSEKLGTVAYGDNQEEVFLGHSVARTQNVSEETARMIDEEVKRLVRRAWDEAKRILTERLDDLHKVAKALLEFETLLENDIKPNREEDIEPPSTGPAVSVPVTRCRRAPCPSRPRTTEGRPAGAAPFSSPFPSGKGQAPQAPGYGLATPAISHGPYGRKTIPVASRHPLLKERERC
jgi:hypothetical protein